MMHERSPYRIGVLLAVGMMVGSMLPVVGLSATMRAERREMKRDEALLRVWLSTLPRDSGVMLARDDAQVMLRFPSALVFDPDTSTLSADAMNCVPLLTTLKLMQQRRRLSAQILVYTDRLGGISASQSLSNARAAALASALVRGGIAAPRLQSQGAGSGHELASDATPEGRSENRRIEIEFRRTAALNRRGQQTLELGDRTGFDLPDALGGYAVLVGELM